MAHSFFDLGRDLPAFSGCPCEIPLGLDAGCLVRHFSFCSRAVSAVEHGVGIAKFWGKWYCVASQLCLCSPDILKCLGNNPTSFAKRVEQGTLGLVVRSRETSV